MDFFINCMKWVSRGNGRLMYRTYTDFSCRVRVAGSFSDWYPMSCGIHQGGVLSLNKYIVFINALLVDLEVSNLCCSIFCIPSSPAGYADDIAAATTFKNRTDNVHDMVYKWGRKWRFNFNASKSAVMMFGEDRKTNAINSKHRVFRLGKERVKEEASYDHVGVKMCIFNDDTTRIEEKISKGRKTLNASSDLGIQKNDLALSTCNMIFWQVVVPTITFGCEVWVPTDKDEELILLSNGMQVKECNAFHRGLGWLKLTSYINIKRLLFVLTILKMVPVNPLRRIFELRFEGFRGNTVKCRENEYSNPIYNIMDVAVMYGLVDAINGMLKCEVPISLKRAWSKLIWERAWKLEDANLRASNMIFKDNDILSLTVCDTRYITGWQISDLDFRLMKMCETMSKLVCHANLLKRDDCRLKRLPMSNRTCINCDMYCIEDITHILMQCPYYQDDRNC